MEPLPSQPEPGESIEDFRLRQKRAALDLARAQRTRLRLFRTAIKKEQIDDLEVLRGNLQQFEVLVSNWPVRRMLEACRDIGPSRAWAILRVADLSPQVKMGRLSFEKRAELAKLVKQARDPYGSLVDRD